MCYVVVGVPICIFIRSRNVSFHISLLLSNINVRLLLQVSRRLLTFSEFRFYGICFTVLRVVLLRSLPTNTTGQLDVLTHEGTTLRMYRT